MNKGFWKKYLSTSNVDSKPILALAPMADVTDAAFRSVISKYGKPDVMFTEFVSCDGLCSEGKKNLLHALKHSEKERPIVAQFFGAKPENFYKCAQLAQELGLDGIDINMGCPDKSVQKQGAGAMLIQNPELAKKIIKETVKGAGKLPVSVKTRIGYHHYNEKDFRNWLLTLLEEGPAAITVHGRTKKEMSLVPAHWDIIGKAVKIRDKFDSSTNKTLILGNGDVKNVAEAYDKTREYGVDGIMIGRAIFGNPWLFAEGKSDKEKLVSFATPFATRRRERRKFSAENYASQANDISFSQVNKLKVLLEHTKLYEKMYKGRKASFITGKNFDIMKKHFKAYVSGFIGAKELRAKLMACKNANEVEKILNSLQITK